MRDYAALFKALVPGLICAAALSLVACGGGGSGGHAENAGLSLAQSLSEPDANGVVTINVTGLPADAGEIPASAFTVDENGSPRPIISVEKIDENSTRAGADIAFVLDTTKSMTSAIESAKNSIIGFVDHLRRKGLDVRVGAVTFGDAFDTKAASGGTAGVSLTAALPPAFDSDERPTFALSEQFDDFKTFLAQQQARNGGKDRENGLGALEFAYDHTAWRPGAQRILIAITDTCAYNAAKYQEDEITAAWAPSTDKQVLAKLKGQAIVHVIAPALVRGCPFIGYTDMAAFTGAAGTGGVHVEWDGKSLFALPSLSLTEAVTAGYLIKYVTGTDGKRTVRLVVENGDVRGEATATGG